MKKPDYWASVDPLSDFPGCRALEDGIKAASSFWGDPAPYLRKAKNAGAIVIQTVATPEEAPRAAYFGTDIIVARGVESGGHVWSTVSTMVLVCDAAPDVPVVAAGGIAVACGVRAALALGAQGEWLGTRFLATVELGAHDDFKIRLVAARAKARSSVLFPTGSRSGAKGCRRQFRGPAGRLSLCRPVRGLASRSVPGGFGRAGSGPGARLIVAPEHFWSRKTGRASALISRTLH